MQLDVLKIDGSPSGEKVELSPAVFEIEPNDHAIYQVVTAHLANARQGTHKTKTRKDVRGGGKKPWKQKHTGRARSGSIRNPIWVGGGTIFGPKPHTYEKKVNDKVRILAEKSALTYKAKDSGVVVVEDFSLEEIKSKKVIEILNSLGLKGKKTLMLIPGKDKRIMLSTRNLPRVFAKEAVEVSVYEILNNEVIVFQKSALTALQDKLTRSKAKSGIGEAR